ncbi:MAG: hypothetical protein R3C27_01840 [Hyphomonadaceae bacterium]
MNKLWVRLKAAFFLAMSTLAIVPAAALTWFRMQGNDVTMEPLLELWVWGVALASGVVLLSVKLLTAGR